MIYLLEDDDSIRKLVIYALQSQGYEAAGFERPSEFWHAMGRRLPELVLLDVMLPEEDGLSVLKKLRSATATAAIPVIMLTAKNTEFDRVTGLDCGADDFVSKPFGMMELLALGWLESRTEGSDQFFRDADIYRVRKLERICCDFELPVVGGTIIVDLLERIDALEHKVRELQGLED